MLVLPVMKVANISGKRIREMRKGSNLKLVELSAALDVDYNIKLSEADLSKIEHNQRGVKDYELYAFAQFFEVPMDSLVCHYANQTEE